MVAPRVVIFSDSAADRKALASLLEQYPDRLELRDYPSATDDQLERTGADVAIVISTHRVDGGLDLAAGVATEGLFDKIVFHSPTLTPAQAVRAVDLGVDALFARSTDARKVVDDLEKVVVGVRVVHEFPTEPIEVEQIDVDDIELTAREAELLEHVAHGLSNREIAAEMYLAESTVKTYMKRLYRRLGVNSRAQCVMRAHELGVSGE